MSTAELYVHVYSTRHMSQNSVTPVCVHSNRSCSVHVLLSSWDATSVMKRSLQSYADSKIYSKKLSGLALLNCTMFIDVVFP